MPWFPESAPGNLGLLLRAGFNVATFPLRMAQPLRRNWSTLQSAAKTFVGEFLGRAEEFPLTRFNSEVSPHRVFDTRRFALKDFKAIRGLVPGATVNDAVLAVCAGGLRRYLDLQGELPDDSLVAAAPIAVRQALAAIDGGLDLNLQEGLAHEQSCYEVTLPTADRLEGIAAFAEKRKPVYRGR